METVRILGIDPGFGRMGYGIIEQKTNNDWRCLAYGCLETDPKKTFVDRLAEVHSEVEMLIKKFSPTRLAVEELFFFKNLKTAIQVAQARGVILLTGIENKLTIDEFTPLQIKQAITGYGRADKQQIQQTVQMLLRLKDKITSDDAADALAIALCAAQNLWTHKLR